jgi:hypothetical protein
MPYFRIMMKAVPGHMPECWAECGEGKEIRPLIAGMRARFGPDEPARVMLDDGYGNESLFLVDDPKGLFEPGEAEGPHYEFDQQDHGATMPEQVSTHPGTCSQCGRKGDLATVNLEGLGQIKTVTPCAECLFDIAAGTDVVPIGAMVETAHEALRPHLPPAGPTHLRYAWDGVGEWMA